MKGLLWVTVSGVLDGCLSLSLQAVAGLLADARSLAEVAREEASNFRSNYGHDIPLKVGFPTVRLARLFPWWC